MSNPVPRLLETPVIRANAPAFRREIAQEMAKAFTKQAQNMHGDETAAARLADMAVELAGNPHYRRCAIETLHTTLTDPTLPLGAHTPLAATIIKLVGEPAPMKRRYHDALEHAAHALHQHPYAAIATARYIRMATLMDNPDQCLLNATAEAPAGSYLEQATAEALVERLSNIPDIEEARIRLLRASSGSPPERTLRRCAYKAYSALRADTTRPAPRPSLFSRRWFAGLRKSPDNN